MLRISFLILFILVAGLLFADFSVTPTIGIGCISGSRAFSDEDSSYRRLSADGIEAGVILSQEIRSNLSLEIYFSYLFALRGDMVLSPSQRTSPGQIPSDMKYTDYKAGLGLGYLVDLDEKNSLDISCGINFAGVSNHRYISPSAAKKIENEITGDKVTSFGLFLELAEHFHHSENLDFVVAAFGCFNVLGWIRTLENHKWINHFTEKADIMLASLFARLGVCYRF